MLFNKSGALVWCLWFFNVLCCCCCVLFVVLLLFLVFLFLSATVFFFCLVVTVVLFTAGLFFSSTFAVLLFLLVLLPLSWRHSGFLFCRVCCLFFAGVGSLLAEAFERKFFIFSFLFVLLFLARCGCRRRVCVDLCGAYFLFAFHSGRHSTSRNSGAFTFIGGL